MAAAAGGLWAQDIDSEHGYGTYTPGVDFTADNGLKFSILGYAPFRASVRNSGSIWYSGHEAYDNLSLPADEAYTHCGTGEYSGDIVVDNTVRIGSCDFTVNRIGYAAFASCPELTSVSLPGTLSDVRRGAFYGCTALAQVDIAAAPEGKAGRTALYPAVFRGCTALRKVNLGDAWMVYEGIFGDCPALTEVTMPTDGPQLNVFLGRNYFGLTKITCTSSDPAQEESADKVFFSDDEFANTLVVVPDGSEAAYRSHPVWGRFANILEQSGASVTAVEADTAWRVVRTGALSAQINGDHEGLTVYRADGRLVASVAAGDASFSVPSRGLYIVFGCGRSQKIIF